MPLKRWFVSHSMPGWYSWVVVVLLTSVSMGGALVISLTANQRSIEREQQARAEAEQAICDLVSLYDKVYQQEPPTTPTGVSIARGIKQFNEERCS